jgi:ABC-type lipoprotein release transport system permease subunit
LGRLTLVLRLAARDLWRRRTESLMLLLAFLAATATLTLGLLLHGQTEQPYQQTRAATRGPDVTFLTESGPTNTTSPVDVAAVTALAHAPGVVASSGLIPTRLVPISAHGVAASSLVEGRSQTPSAVDRPEITSGTWIRPGGVVVERAFADALDLHLGEVVSVHGTPLRVVGTAVTAAFTPYPQICEEGCYVDEPDISPSTTGVMWTTTADFRHLKPDQEPINYLMEVKLAHPGQAEQFADTHGGTNATPWNENSWLDILRGDGQFIQGEQTIMLVGATLLSLLALASVAVLVGGRMAEQMRRVGLLKAVGGSPGLVAGVLLAEYVAIALLASGLGLLVGWLLAPVVGGPSSGLLGTVGPPPLTATSALTVVLVAIVVALLASFLPAWRAARTSTVVALADSARRPKRRRLLIALSNHLPLTLLLALRITARRPRRTVLSVVSIMVTVSGIVAVMIVHNQLSMHGGVVLSNGLVDPRTQKADQLMAVITVMLVALAAVNAIFITRSTVADTRHATALTRALGATPARVTAGLAAAQVIPAFLGALLGIPGGFLLYQAAKHGASTPTYPPVIAFIALVVGTVVVLSVLAAVPAGITARRSVSPILGAETA